MLPRPAFLLRTSPTHSKNVLNMIKLRFDFRFKRRGHEATEKRKAKRTINCHYPDISWNSRCLLLWNFHTNFSPLFNRFSTFDKNVNLSKANPEAKNFFLTFPSLNTLIFFFSSTNLKIASTLRPFERLDAKVTLPKNTEV